MATKRKDDSLSDYVVLREIGSGSFGKVSKVRRVKDGQVLVWKEIKYDKMSEKEKKLLVSEVNLLRSLHHANIVRYHDRIVDNRSSTIYIIMEYCEGGDVAKLIRRYRRERSYISEEVIWKVFAQVASALRECHERRILHRDLKPGNVMLDAAGNVKLGDFGLARVMGLGSVYAHTFVGTPAYMSPEQATGAYDERSDIWSLGCLIYELATLRPPFDAANQRELLKKMKTGIYRPMSSRYSSALKDAVASMLKVNPSERPRKVADLLTLPKIAMHLREVGLKRHYAGLKQREADVERREKDVARREQEVEARERAVALKEKMMARPPIASVLDTRVAPARKAKIGTENVRPKPLLTRQVSAPNLHRIAAPQ